MTNHPNRNRTYFMVRYSGDVAKFSSNRDAMYFAEAKSTIGGFRDHLIEVHHRSGIVGQYLNGRTTPEFQLHHECRDNG